MALYQDRCAEAVCELRRGQKPPIRDHKAPNNGNCPTSSIGKNPVMTGAARPEDKVWKFVSIWTYLRHHRTPGIVRVYV